jgi:hypothetical protein
MWNDYSAFRTHRVPDSGGCHVTLASIGPRGPRRRARDHRFGGLAGSGELCPHVRPAVSSALGADPCPRPAAEPRHEVQRLHRRHPTARNLRDRLLFDRRAGSDDAAGGRRRRLAARPRLGRHRGDAGTRSADAGGRHMLVVSRRRHDAVANPWCRTEQSAPVAGVPALRLPRGVRAAQLSGLGAVSGGRTGLRSAISSGG